MSGLSHEAEDPRGDASPSAASPEAARRLYADVLNSLQTHIVGQDDVVRSLALVGARHVLGASMQRVLLVGPPASGKTLVARHLALILGDPYVEIPVGSMAEEGWSGASPSDHLRALLGQAGTRLDLATGEPRDSNRGVVLLDDLDRARSPGTYATAATQEQRGGKQTSLLPLLGDGVVAIERSLDAPVVWRSRRALVIATGEFAGLAAHPSAVDFIDWGFLPPIATRLARALILRIAPLGPRHILRAIELQLHQLSAQFEAFGYQLQVPDTTLAYVASRFAHEAHGPPLGSATASIENAARRALVGLLGRDAPNGTLAVISPDDLQLPQQSRGLWRE